MLQIHEGEPVTIEPYESTIARLVDHISRGAVTISESALAGLFTNYLLKWDEEKRRDLWKRSDLKPFTIVRPGELVRYAGNRHTIILVAGALEHSEVLVSRTEAALDKKPLRLIVFAPQPLEANISLKLAQYCDAFFCVDPYHNGGERVTVHEKYNLLYYDAARV